MKKIKIKGVNYTRCDLDEHLCIGEKCENVPPEDWVMCSSSWNKNLSEYAIEIAAIIAERTLDAARRNKPLGAEYIEIANKILEIKEVMD